MNDSITWPPNYTVRRSHRAKHIGLSITVKRGLEVVVPAHYKKNNFDKLLSGKRAWIEKYLREMQLEQQQRGNLELPNSIIFPALDEHWSVSYITQLSSSFRLMLRPHRELVVLGNLQQKAKCFSFLKKWLHKHAKATLIPWFNAISQEINLPYESIIIRGQHTRWGSCSARKSISLNYKLLFLRPELARYVMVHELCHTVHLDHSQRFWHLVAKFDPDWEVHRERLNHVRSEIPLWVE